MLALQAYYMKLHNIDTQKGSFALTMLSFAECITYITASFLGDYIKGALNVLQVTGGCRKATRNYHIYMYMYPIDKSSEYVHTVPQYMYLDVHKFIWCWLSYS